MPIMNPEPMDTEQKRKPEHTPKDAPSSSISTPRPEQRATSTPTRKAKRSKQAHTPAVSGLGPHDLPDAGPNPNPAIEYYLNLPVQRTLDWQTDRNNRPVIRELTNNLSRLAAFVQTRGTVTSEPCTFCREHLGVWKACIIGSDTTADTKIHGSCANCRFSRRYTCAHRIHCESSEDIGSSSGTREGTDPSSQPLASQEVHIARPVSDEEAERFLLLLQPSSSQGQSGPTTQAPSNVQESEHSKSVTWTKVPEPGRTMTCMTAASSEDGRVKCRHDGKAIAFPLRPEAFHNLPLLKQALLDMTQHYDVIRRRIEQIEGTEPHQSTVNPWDLVKGG
ncbi:hypothetical protein ANOM_001939 [Aspergillus nomiae NRRL 13137]|uniref:Uncharacterized protein n=1 Tax=Aspergillus nomiae NRRL (strain ATCC 15546 / NRRL 13137 / CBS 260.88 / M93) TaxID=1509407 RepID=A0A0L1JCU0_ASPN3|nr:uncharacterized protein ANOM_001939 [Aspergillus nomiae NRRL 13137]KNG89546.1 hypothetical protein ANOM_001939 [Aspergillus nomiae NRRL 13137]